MIFFSDKIIVFFFKFFMGHSFVLERTVALFCLSSFLATGLVTNSVAKPTGEIFEYDGMDSIFTIPDSRDTLLSFTGSVSHPLCGIFELLSDNAVYLQCIISMNRFIRSSFVSHIFH